MDQTTKIVQEYYDATVLTEWNRIAGRPEFLLTCRFIDRYIKPGDRVLDIGGGPGRYSLYLASKGCNVTLLDLSPGNVVFAREEAARQGVPLTAIAGDARNANEFLQGPFDHVLLMGPMYHLLEEAQRVQAVEAALALLQSGGLLYVSFISMFAGIIYGMTHAPELILSPVEQAYHRMYLEGGSLAGHAFTEAYFARQEEILPFMARFPLEKLHFFSQEGVVAPCESNIMGQPPEIVTLWLDLCEQLCERPELLSWAEHLMYIGRRY